MPRIWILFVKFGGLSALGWLLDFVILLTLVHLFSISPAIANFISSSIAALTVFLMSREIIFTKAQGVFFGRVAAYFAYTACVIAIASLAMHFLALELPQIAARIELRPSGTVIAAVAKVIVTPPQLILNFVMSRLLSEYRFKRSGSRV